MVVRGFDLVVDALELVRLFEATSAFQVCLVGRNFESTLYQHQQLRDPANFDRRASMIAETEFIRNRIVNFLFIIRLNIT